jgi:hypothetical protein
MKLLTCIAACMVFVSALAMERTKTVHTLERRFKFGFRKSSKTAQGVPGTTTGITPVIVNEEIVNENTETSEELPFEDQGYPPESTEAKLQ